MTPFALVLNKLYQSSYLPYLHSVPTLACFRKKLKSYLLKKAFPPLYVNYKASPWYRPAYVDGIMIIELVFDVALLSLPWQRSNTIKV